MKILKIISLIIISNFILGNNISSNINDDIINSANQNEYINVWVYFLDKGPINVEQEINKIILTANESQINRRSKSRQELFDFRDIAVYKSYIEQILVDDSIALRTTSNWLNAISINLPVNLIEKISKKPFIDKIEKVNSGKRREIISIQNHNTSIRNDYGPSYNQLEQINVIEAHENGYMGQGIKILVLDTGFYTEHESINENNILDEWDFINNDNETQNEDGDVDDQHNHGTYILSVIGGAKEGQLYGPAYEANFFLAKTEDLTQEQPIEEDWFVAALEWGESLGADISSSSLGYIDWYDYEDLNGHTAVTTIGINIATENGMVCVTSAGNSGNDGIIAPADAYEVISVGAVDSDGELTWFSSRGPTADGRIKPEVCAQGLETYAAIPSYDQYGYLAGTSLSCPLVSGSCAIIMSARPEWPSYMVRKALLNSSDNSENPNNEYGWGIIDVMAAIHYYDGSGDINYDGELNIIDLVQIVSMIVEQGIEISEGELEISDGNDDQILNVLDLIYFINLIIS